MGERKRGSGRETEKSFIALFASLLFCTLILELSAPLIHAMAFHKNYSRDAVLSSRDALISGNPSYGENLDSEFEVWGNLPHPYLGYAGGRENNEFGFHGQNPVFEKKPGQVVVGISGGSVGHNLYYYISHDEKTRLSLREMFAGKNVSVISLSHFGYKQPQQLLALAYLLSKGADFDYILNVDGYNELALGYEYNNQLYNISLDYPFIWPRYASSHHVVGELVELKSVRERRKSLAHFFEKIPLPGDFMVVAWKILDSKYGNLEAGQLAKAGEILASKNISKASRGYRKKYADDSMVLDELVRIWRDSSIQMHELCAANNITYIHFIQPNQYDLNKTHQDIIGSRYYNPGRPSRQIIDRGYNIYRDKAAPMLRERGVAVYDTSGLFENISSRIYQDDCCHYTNTGNRIMSEAMIGKIRFNAG